MMSGIKGKNTKPELLVRSFLHRKGLRFRINSKGLPGHPDIVLRKYNTVVFVHGCFWHRHGCSKFVWPKSRAEFWREKLNANAERDKRNFKKLKALGWHVCTVWECRLAPGHLQGLYLRITSRLAGR
jgi:DNA mismatch endonuclease (patch repair protein)